MNRFETAANAVREAQRDAEKEATRLEITQPILAEEARSRADGLSDACKIIENLSGLARTLRQLEDQP